MGEAVSGLFGGQQSVPQRIGAIRGESIRPMTTMERWAMQAQQAYASRDPWKRLDMVPDIGPAAGITKQVPTRFGDLMRGVKASKKPYKEVIEPILELKEAFLPKRASGPSTLATVGYGDIRRFLEEGKKLRVSTEAIGAFDSLSDPSKRKILTHEVGHAMYDALTPSQKARMKELGVSVEDMASGFVVWTSNLKPGAELSSEAKKIIKGRDFVEEIWQGLGPKPIRGDRVGPMAQKAGSGEPYKSMPQSRIGEVSPTSVTPFELQQLGLSRGAPPYKMGK